MAIDGAASSSAPVGFRLKWDVFLSFRGEDTRHGITERLYNSLEEQGVRVFRDDDGLNRGDEIAPKLLEAIEDSAASIVIISPNYASSHWCLEELARIYELRRLILPVFYLVDPSDVRSQRGPFEHAFGNHEQRFGEVKVMKWRRAMNKVGGIAGWVFTEKMSHSLDETLLIRVVVKEVLKEVSNTPMNVAMYAVGLDSRVEELVRLLNVQSNSIEVLGLHGMGGVGKTTLAEALYNKLIGHFEFRSFISNIRELSADHDGLVSLQQKLVCDLSGRTNEFNVNATAIREIFSVKKALVVLDDVDNVSQLDALGAKIRRHCEGSRVIITTRNKEVLHKHYVNQIYEVRELYFDQALELFSYHALRREKPTERFFDLSKQIVSLTGGLPLALEVFGSFLFDKRKIKEWEDALKKLRQIRPNNLQEVLKISYDGLDEQEKCIFLDTACLFLKMEMKREDVIDILKGCGFKAEIAITVLAGKSLIKITEDDTLWMHDQLRDMGRQIVQCENLVDPGMRSRLWDREEILTVLENNKGTRCIQGIVLEKAGTQGKEVVHRAKNEKGMVLCTKPFEPMVSLRLLQVNHAKLEGKFKFLPPELKWLQWQGCTLESLPSDFLPQKLAVLDLSGSKIKQLWGSYTNKVAENLMVLNLHGCYNLASIPDLSGHQHLGKLVLEGCRSLIKIHESVGHLSSLIHLNLRDCTNLVEFPSDVFGLKNLQTLILDGCSTLKELPEGIGSMKSLKELFVDKTEIAKLPESLCRLRELEKLSLNGCKCIKRLPERIGKLGSLQELFLNQSSIEELPDSIGSLVNLEKLSLMWCSSLNKIPDTVGNLRLLANLFINGSAVKELPYSIGSLSYLRGLSIGECHYICILPDSIEGLASILELQLNGTSITDLPNQIGALKLLEKLEIRNCRSLRFLPESIGSLFALTSLNIFNGNITELPESIGLLENLIILRLNKCKRLCKLPTSIGNLKALHHLWMEETAITDLPESFGMLSNLMVLKMLKRPLFRLPGSNGRNDTANLSTLYKPTYVVLPTSFSNLSLLRDLDARSWGISGKIPDDFEKLSALEILNLGNNKFSSLPSSLRGLSLLKKLLLAHCQELESLPPLPSTLEEINLTNCISLERVSDLSNLRRLQELSITNCDKVVDIPGLESLKSMRRLYMSNCNACCLAGRRRLSKVYMKNLTNLSMPGSKIPDWFRQGVICFSSQKSREIKAVIIAVVISINHEIPDDLRYEVPVVPDIQARILNGDKLVFQTALQLMGVPMTRNNNFHLCRYPSYHPLVSSMKDGFKIQVTKQDPPFLKGVELKQAGIHLVYEDEDEDDDDDDDDDDESLDDSQQSLSERLAKFFSSLEVDDQEYASIYEVEETVGELKGEE